MRTVEQLALQQMTLSLEAFAQKIAGPCVLMRLDERGGDDEPTPWALHYAGSVASSNKARAEELDVREIRLVLDDVTAQSAPLEGPSQNVFTGHGDAEETLTRTYAGEALLPVPPARGAAQIIVVPVLVEDEVDIGRVEQEGVCLLEMSVSRRHAGLKRSVDGVAFLIWDAGSKNGTQVNGRLLRRGEKAVLKPGDVVEFGDVRCLFLDIPKLYEHLPLCMD